MSRWARKRARRRDKEIEALRFATDMSDADVDARAAELERLYPELRDGQTARRIVDAIEARQ